MPKNRNRPRKRRSPKVRHGFPPAPERPSSPRGQPFPRGNEIGLPTRYQAGQTGNAGGVPKDVAEYRELMRARIPTMLARLDDVFDHGTEEGVIKAIREVNANAFPRPAQAIELGGPGGGPIAIKAELTSDEKRARAAALIAKAKSLVKPKPGTEGDGSGSAD